MGLCKCPRKKVTTLFCFEHRVNVCEHCLVANHPKCVVQSYLAWLQDSDFDPTCSLCGHGFQDNDAPVVRLMCLHVFHWACLSRHYSSLPANTAPAGYSCPQCQEHLFPKQNQQSPIIDALTEQLKKANWARAGLGLPLIAEEELSSQMASVHPGQIQQQNTFNGWPYERPTGSSTVLSMDGGLDSASGMRKMFGSELEPLLSDQQNDVRNSRSDPDEQKYKRRSAWSWLSRWLKSRSASAPVRHDRLYRVKRLCLFLLLAVIALIIVVSIINRLAHSQTKNADPFLDPLANPNIRVAVAADRDQKPQ